MIGPVMAVVWVYWVHHFCCLVRRRQGVTARARLHVFEFLIVSCLFFFPLNCHCIFGLPGRDNTRACDVLGGGSKWQ